MKYYKRLKVYKASNVSFDPESMVADSYDWWHFVELINGAIVFNDYSYSASTNGHQSKVKSLLRELNIEVDVVVKTRAGLQASYGVHSKIELGTEAMREAVYAGEFERAEKIAKVFKLKLTQDFIQEVYNQKEIDLCDAYLERAFEYSEKKRREAEDHEAMTRFSAASGETILTLLNGGN